MCVHIKLHFQSTKMYVKRHYLSRKTLFGVRGKLIYKYFYEPLLFLFAVLCLVLPLLNSCWFYAGFGSSVTDACN